MPEVGLESLELPNYIIEVGVISGESKERKTIQFGVTNAELMFIHENGSPLQHIPARPVLKLTLDWVKETNLIINTVVKCVGIMIATNGDLNEVDKEMNKMAIKIQNYARKIIYSNDGRLAPNAPSTIARKGDNHPLFDTGQLARSITCRAIRI